MTNFLRAAVTETANVYHLNTVPGAVSIEQFEDIRQANVGHNIELIREAHRRGVQVICLGELFPAPYFAITPEVNPQWLEFAEDAQSGPTIEAIRRVTAEHALVVIAPIYEVENDRRYNTAVVVDKGEVMGKCRKTHIPHGSNERGPFTESFYYRRSDYLSQNADMPNVVVGDHPLMPAFNTSAGRIGVNICYGRHFPETWEALRDQRAQLVFSPAITFGETSEEVWEHEFPVAALNGYFIGASNRIGREFPGGPKFFGKSYFVGPDGKKLQNLSGHPGLVAADLDLTKAYSDPAGWRLAENERTDI